ncbi:MAG: STN domain-containing protein [Fidelibacterota bacterium]|nr:MAG: STN domain-containing protein [Candidatus Neomarinimicrobiota bacterium]
MGSIEIIGQNASGRESRGYGGLMYRILVICIALLVIPWLSPTPGQEDSTLIQLEELDGQRAPAVLLNRISLQFGLISFEDALMLISQRGRVGISYNHSHLPLDQPVSLQLQDVSVLDALLSLLAQTGTDLVITNEGQLVVVSRKPSEKNNPDGH